MENTKIDAYIENLLQRSKKAKEFNKSLILQMKAYD
jgi:hypothetical protein